MNDFESYYECKRCLFQTHQKNDMKRHLNKINKCTRNFESFKYKDEELNVLSLQIIYNKAKEYLCIGCNKKYSNKSNLERHVKEYCKNTNNIKDLINTFHKNLHNSTDNNNSDNIYIYSLHRVGPIAIILLPAIYLSKLLPLRTRHCPLLRCHHAYWLIKCPYSCLFIIPEFSLIDRSEVL